MFCDPWIEVLSRLGLFTSYQNKTGRLSKFSAASAQQVALTVAAYVAHLSDRPCWRLEVCSKEPKSYFTTFMRFSCETIIYTNVKRDRWFRVSLLCSPLQRHLDIMFWCFWTVEFQSICGGKEIRVSYLSLAEMWKQRRDLQQFSNAAWDISCTSEHSKKSECKREIIFRWK